MVRWFDGVVACLGKSDIGGYQLAKTPSAGAAIDLAPFGKIIYFVGDDPRKQLFDDAAATDGAHLPSEPDATGRRHLGLQWAEPRDIYSVAVTYDGETPYGTEVQYWQKKWPFDDRDFGRGGGRGWIGRDDHYRGKWITALSDATIDGNRAVYDFHHLDLTEIWDPEALDRAEDFNAEFRCALQFRLLFAEGVEPRVKRIEAFTKGEWQSGEVDIFGVGDACVRATNGHVTEITRHDDALSVKYLYIPPPAFDLAHRHTVITIDDADHPFSFRASDVINEPLYIEDFGILVRPACDDRAPEQIVDALVASGSKTIYDKVLDEPEQTFERAMAESPRLRPAFQHAPRGRYVPLGCEGSKQRFGLRYNGSIFVNKAENKAMGRDLVNLLWSGVEMNYRFATGDFPDFREREGAVEQSWSEDGAPVITSVWTDRDIEFTQTVFAAYLRDDMAGCFGISDCAPVGKSSHSQNPETTGAEDIVLLVQFEMRNISRDTRKAHLWLQSSPFECVEYDSGVLSAHGRLIKTEMLDSDELAARADRPDVPHTFNWIARDYDRSLIRCRIDLGNGCGYVTPLSMDREGPAGIPTAFHYQADLAGGERDVVTFAIPYCTLTGEDGALTVASLDYNAKLRDVREFWTRYVDSSAKIEIPDKMIERFYRNVPVHVAITATKDPGSGEYVLPAATLCYGACGNEACIQIRQIDYRGLHKQAERYLDGLLLVQGADGLDGNFQSKEGALAGASFYDGKSLGAPFAYNSDHGFILQSLAEHYFLTRDADWLKRVAANIVAGCDFVTRERQATQIEQDGERVPEYGLLPAGHLEDNDDWRHWFAVNGHACLGIEWAAKALAEIDHPDTQRIADEATAYKQDILTALERARIESPLVRLPDNTAIPHVPIRTDIRGPEWGWFREAAYGPLHLVDGGVLEPDDQSVTWILKYLEDVIFPSRDWGRPIDIEKRWFSQAGLTIQANLLNNGVAYVKRDQPRHAVRALFNDFAASVYQDVLVFTEHPVVQLGRGVGPYYKTPDECGFLNLLRACMVIEQGDTLYLAKAAPVSWFRAGEKIELRDAATYFGPVSYTITVTDDAIEARVKPPRRNPPAKLALRLRRADGKPIKSVTGGEWDAEREIVWLEPNVDEITMVAGS